VESKDCLASSPVNRLDASTAVMHHFLGQGIGFEIVVVQKFLVEHFTLVKTTTVPTSATEGTTAAALVCKFVVDMMVVDSKFMDFAIDADSYADILQDSVV
jgi:hypothetical protein